MKNTAIGPIWGRLAIVQVAGLNVVVALLMVILLAAPAYAAPGTFTVTNTNDSGAGSLRQAILDANANNNPGEQDRIDFNISGTGVHTIKLASPLPFVTEPVNINGYSQPGTSVNTLEHGTNARLLIELDGAALNALNEHGLIFMTPNSVVRGLVINRFEHSGIVLSTYSANTSIKGNFIGTHADGIHGGVDVGNGQNGVGIAFTAGNNNVIGGTSPAARNIISDNQLNGVEINSDNNVVAGNLIGTARDGTSPLGNSSSGVQIGSSALSNVVGGASSGPANTIAFNGSDGVFLYSGISNSILSNSIFSNNGSGIYLGAGANDPQDPDTGANNWQNKPNLTSATNSSGTTIKGRLNSTPNATFTIEFFSNPAGTDEGKIFLGKKEVSTGQDGLVLFQKNFTPAVKVGRTITATATNTTTHDTSEFSAAREVTAS